MTRENFAYALFYQITVVLFKTECIINVAAQCFLHLKESTDEAVRELLAEVVEREAGVRLLDVHADL